MPTRTTFQEEKKKTLNTNMAKKTYNMGGCRTNRIRSAKKQDLDAGLDIADEAHQGGIRYTCAETRSTQIPS